MNMNVPMNFMNLPPNLMQNLSGVLNQNPMLANLGMMGMNNVNGMSAMDLQQMLMRCNNQNVMFGGYPMNMNMNMGMMNMGVQPMNNGQIGITPKNDQRPISSLFNEQVSSFKSQPENKDPKVVFPLKRSAYHAAISYRIYIDKLKK